MSDIKILKEIDLLWGMNDKELELFRGIAQIRNYPAETLIFAEGDPSDELYVLLEGMVEIYTELTDGSPRSLGILRSGSAFGEMALINEKPRSANAKAIEDSVLMRVLREDFLDLIDTHPIFSAKALINLSRTLSNRLRATNKVLRQTMEWNLKTSGASETSFSSLIQDSRKVRLRVSSGEDFAGIILKVEPSPIGMEITFQDEMGQVFLIPQHSLVYIHVEQTVTTLPPLSWQ